MVEAYLLGTAQDAGVPQAGCSCTHCSAARNGDVPPQYAVSLGLVDHSAGQAWLIDATPDFKQQLHLLDIVAPNCQLAGIFLTHLHVGHYAGLIHLGKEIMNTQRLPVYATPLVCQALRSNAPWSLLVKHGNIRLQEVSQTARLKLTNELSLQPCSVPHRADIPNTDTMAYTVFGPRRQLFYCPDIDSWNAWERSLEEVVLSVDVALLDATFYHKDELPGRSLRDIPHPLVTATAALLEGKPALAEREVVLVHLNHSNPLYRPTPEQKRVLDAGFHIGRQGQCWDL